MYCIILYDKYNIWCIMMYYDVLWCIMMYYDVLWCIMMYCDVLWCIVMYCDVLWCVMMYYDVFRNCCNCFVSCTASHGFVPPWWGLWTDSQNAQWLVEGSQVSAAQLCDAMWCYVMLCDAMWCYVSSMCDLCTIYSLFHNGVTCHNKLGTDILRSSHYFWVCHVSPCHPNQ